jgi:hypothetical protein
MHRVPRRKVVWHGPSRDAIADHIAQCMAGAFVRTFKRDYVRVNSILDT